ncbi:MAG: hypothetical protein KDE47_24065 [Caldilineaceae bacterium]|nr:hypothetical protein [Caldilineaceae bacterium]
MRHSQDLLVPKFEPLQALGHRIYGKIDQLLHISLSELDNIRELLSIVAFFDGLINLADSVYPATNVRRSFSAWRAALPR